MLKFVPWGGVPAPSATSPAFNRQMGDDSQCAGQDLIEYALMAGLIATGIVTMSPAVASAFVDMMSKVNSVVAVAGS